MQVYNDEYLLHFGIPGMKWGHRKGPSTKDMRKDRFKISKTEFTKANKKYDVYGRKSEQDYEKAYEKASNEANKKIASKMLKKYGRQNINRLSKSDKIRFNLGVASIVAIPAVIMAATIASDLRK